VRITYSAHSFGSFTVFPSCRVVGSFCLIYCSEVQFLAFCVVSLLIQVIQLHFSSLFIDLNMCLCLSGTDLTLAVCTEGCKVWQLLYYLNI
jgi:hypothetical protein